MNYYHYIKIAFLIYSASQIVPRNFLKVAFY